MVVTIAQCDKLVQLLSQLLQLLAMAGPGNNPVQVFAT
jgi:hypothetical protein